MIGLEATELAKTAYRMLALQYHPKVGLNCYDLFGIIGLVEDSKDSKLPK